MTKFIRALQSKFPIDSLYYVISCLGAIFLFLCLTDASLFWIIMLLLSVISLLRKWKFLVLFMVLSALVILSWQLFYSKNLMTYQINGKYEVKKMTSFGPIIKYKGSNILLNNKYKIHVGDILFVKGNITLIENNDIFDKLNYFKAKNTFNEIKFPKIFIDQKTNDIRADFHEYLLKGPGDYKKVTPLLLLGIKTHESREIYNSAIEMNIVHLFVISGFHISLFFLIFNKILKVCRVKESISMWISLVPILIYLFMMYFPISATRAGFLSFAFVFNKNILKGKFNSIALLSLVCGFMFVISPYSIYSMSFILTFLTTLVIILVNQFKFKSNTSKYIAILIFVHLSNLMIIMSMNGYYSLFGIVYGIILSPAFVFMYSITLFLFPFKNLMSYLDIGFIYLIKILYETRVLIDVPKYSVKWIYLFYGFIYFALLNTTFLMQIK